MTHGLFFDKRAPESPESVPKEIRERIFRKLQGAKENPAHFFERRENRSDYKPRIGDYRLDADMDHALKRIEATLVDHGGRICKRLGKGRN